MISAQSKRYVVGPYQKPPLKPNGAQVARAGDTVGIFIGVFVEEILTARTSCDVTRFFLAVALANAGAQ